jgi:TonB family protein
MEVRLYRTPVVLSLVVHFAFCAALITAWQTRPMVVPPQQIWIEIEPSRQDNDRSKQVVQSHAGQKSDQAAKDAYLGKDTRVVDRETVSQTLHIPETVGGAPRTKSAASQPKPETRDRAAKDQKIAALAKFGVAYLPKVQEKPKDTARWADYADSFGSVPTDYVKGLKESESTALNTREFVYYGYFQRIRSQLDYAWQSVLKEKLRKLYFSGRSLASERDHTTKTVVTLNAKGEIVRVQLVEESGVVDLDDAAVRAFNQAGPFPNPPREMVNKSGEIEIRWDFILKT